tara:strand:+ start:14991 stop:15284 length:294 start_codon:yes stop_codon:yes gene_type:complete
MADDYKTNYSRKKNVNTLSQGSFNDFGDNTPARQVLLNKLNKFSPSKDVDAITVEYPSAAVELYEFRIGGIAGAIDATVTVTYTGSNKKDLLNVVAA